MVKFKVEVLSGPGREARSLEYAAIRLPCKDEWIEIDETSYDVRVVSHLQDGTAIVRVG